MNRGMSAMALCMFTALAVWVLLPTAALSQEAVYLELQDVQKSPIPGNGSGWHQLYPAFCTPHVQDDYVDSDGDGEVTVCDYIKLDGAWFHIEWSGPTYHLNCQEPSTWEPVGPDIPGDPTCQQWQRIVPFGPTFHVDGWDDDNGDGVVSPCDFIAIAGQICHIEDIRLNITVRPGDPVGSESGTWGEVKSQY